MVVRKTNKLLQPPFLTFANLDCSYDKSADNRLIRDRAWWVNAQALTASGDLTSTMQHAILLLTERRNEIHNKNVRYSYGIMGLPRPLAGCYKEIKNYCSRLKVEIQTVTLNPMVNECAVVYNLR
jgi:hypothetical protein